MYTHLNQQNFLKSTTFHGCNQLFTVNCSKLIKPRSVTDMLNVTENSYSLSIFKCNPLKQNYLKKNHFHFMLEKVIKKVIMITFFPSPHKNPYCLNCTKRTSRSAVVLYLNYFEEESNVRNPTFKNFSPYSQSYLVNERNRTSRGILFFLFKI